MLTERCPCRTSDMPFTVAETHLKSSFDAITALTRHSVIHVAALSFFTAIAPIPHPRTVRRAWQRIQTSQESRGAAVCAAVSVAHAASRGSVSLQPWLLCSNQSGRSSTELTNTAQWRATSEWQRRWHCFPLKFGISVYFTSIRSEGTLLFWQD